MHSFSFESPYMLFLLILIPLIYLIYYLSKNKTTEKAIKFSRLELIKQAAEKKLDYKKLALLILYGVAVLAGVLSLAKPTLITEIPVKSTKLMMVFDVSISMEATDLKPDRLTVAKNTAITFIKKLPKGVKVGLEYFYGNAYIPVEPTIEKQKVIDSLATLDAANLFPGTAIGTALQGAVSSLTIAKKINNNAIIVLLTDGETNQGLDPLDAANLAKNAGIKVFTIGIGSREGAFVRGQILSSLDEPTLMEIARITNGRYYRAESQKQLASIYKQLHSTTFVLEKQKIALQEYFTGVFLFIFLVITYLNFYIFRVI